MASTNTSHVGINLFGLLGVVFVTLKLCGVINWSWWWVTLPFWGGLVLVMMILIVLIIILAVMKASGR